MFGWISTICFALSGILPAIDAIATQQSPIPWYLLIVWLTGELCVFVHVAPKRDAPLLVNYLFNIVCLIIIMVIKIKA